MGGDNCLSIIEVAEIIAKVYKSKYGESIPVQINDKDDEKKYNPVHFNINKLKKTGFSLSGNMEKEIEKTLKKIGPECKLTMEEIRKTILQ